MISFNIFMSIVAGILSFISMVLGWFSRELWSAIKELKVDLAKLREEIPQKYVPKDDFAEFREEFRNGLQRLLDKLDSKVDK